MTSNEIIESNIPVAKSFAVRTPNEKIGGVLLSYHEIDPGIGCVSLTGRLDARNVPQIEMVFEFMTTAQKKPVIVDLGGVDLMNSVGLGMLITNANALRVHGARMILLNPQRRVERVIRIACVEQLLPIVRDMAEALKRFSSEQSSAL